MYRIGFYKSGVFPWFDPPAAGAPARYDGWLWDPAKREWIRADVGEATFKIVPKAKPKPTRPPGLAIPSTVEGWKWSETKRVWEPLPMPVVTVAVGAVRPPMPRLPAAHPGVGEVLGWKFDFDAMVWRKAAMPVELVEQEKERPPAPKYPPGGALATTEAGWHWDRGTQQWIPVITATAVVEFEMPRSFPPPVDQAAVNMAYPMSEQYVLFQTNMVNMGLDPSEARRIANMMVDGFWNMSRSALTKHRAELYVKSLQPAAVALSDMLEKVGVYAAVISLAAIVGALIGTIMERLLMPHEEVVGLVPEVETFLLGPDRWYYGRHIGTSATGHLYYSCCDEIGADYYRHKRGTFPLKTDIIDFPGGFLEEGWHIGRFVKYNWTQWNIRYYGFLVRMNDGMFRLKRAPLPAGAPPHIVWSMPEQQWCIDFRYYL